jgi:hypothetical protein
LVENLLEEINPDLDHRIGWIQNLRMIPRHLREAVILDDGYRL